MLSALLTGTASATPQCAGRVVGTGVGDGTFAVVLGNTRGHCPLPCGNRYAIANSAVGYREIVAQILTAAAADREVSVGLDATGCGFSNASVFFP